MLLEEGSKTQGSGEGKKRRRDKEDGRKDWVGRRTTDEGPHFERAANEKRQQKPSVLLEAQPLLPSLSSGGSSTNERFLIDQQLVYCRRCELLLLHRRQRGTLLT